MLKKIYIAVVKFIGSILELIGLFKLLAKYPDNKAALYVRSVFAIYDFEKMAELDLPWWNFKAISEIEKFIKDNPAATVFEYGSGASTIWLSKRCKKVVSLEYDDWFYNKLKSYVSDNVELIHKPADEIFNPIFASNKSGYENSSFEGYVKEIESYGKFDLIIIDGRAREKCFEEACKSLKEGGLILFDDTHRKRYMQAINSENGVKVRSFKGLTPSLIYPNKTSLVSK